MAPRARSIRLTDAVAVAVAAVLLLALLPPIRARAKAVPLLADAVGLAVPRAFAAEVVRREITLGGVPGHLYSGGHPAPGLLLVPGATPAGLADSRVQQAAAAIARSHRTVFVPELALYQQRFDRSDHDRLVRAVLALESHDLTEGRPALLGFSYGGSYTLIAAADPRLTGRLEQVAVFGAYFDLVGVVQAVTTGVSLVGDRAIPYDTPPQAESLLHEAALQLVDPAHRDLLRQALTGAADPAALPEGARSVHELLVNESPARTVALAEQLPPRARALLRDFSPAPVAHRIAAPVVALHSIDDPAVPYGEAVRLASAMPGARVASVRIFDHVDLESTSPRELARALPDVWRSWRFTSWVVSAQEPWFRRG
jgi:pimeloyl-ACP methyl ester carboxylesterase